MNFSINTPCVLCQGENFSLTPKFSHKFFLAFPWRVLYGKFLMDFPINIPCVSGQGEQFSRTQKFNKKFLCPKAFGRGDRSRVHIVSMAYTHPPIHSVFDIP